MKKHFHHKKRHASKRHYDHKGPIKLLFKDGVLIKQHQHDHHSHQHGISVQPESEHYFHSAMEANSLGDHDDQVYFEEDRNENVSMAKAYEWDGEETIMAKAYDLSSDSDHEHTQSHQETIPADQTNTYSDVFNMDEEHLFEEESTAKSMSVLDESDVDDQFARDLQAVLSGQKSLANLVEYADTENTQQTAPKAENQDAVQHAEDKMQKDEQIFNQLALDMNRLKTYQLGEVQLDSIFDSADTEIAQDEQKKKALNLDEIVTEASMSLDGMELAEDFEYMESISEEEAGKEEKSNAHAYIEDAQVEMEEKETVEPSETTAE